MIGRAREPYTGAVMRIKRIAVGMLSANCYIVWSEGSERAVVIDPGAEAKTILAALGDEELGIEAILLTHGHRDHAGAANGILRRLDAPLFRHPADPNGLFFVRQKPADGRRVHDLAGGQTLSLAGIDFNVIHAPGHSPGSVCFHADGDRFADAPAPVLFTGDLLFQGGVGRMDLKGGSERELMKSLARRIAHLPGETDVLPGHGGPTTLGKERRENVFFGIALNMHGKGKLDG